MASSSDTSPEAAKDLDEAAQAAGSALRARLEKNMGSTHQDKAQLPFDPDDHKDILGEVMEKFTKVAHQCRTRRR